jgi:hypothetical protein
MGEEFIKSLSVLLVSQELLCSTELEENKFTGHYLSEVLQDTVKIYPPEREV